MRSSYSENDVILLLKDITGVVVPLSAEIREKKIQSGTHYCEMLPIEYVPSVKYMEAYEFAMKLYAQETADAIAVMSEKIYQKKKRGQENIVIVSLARAGIPIGILTKRYLEKRYSIQVYHYSISIIRGRGIDRNALDYILSRHKASSVQFVDGWTGKGAIYRELKKELENEAGISDELAVVSDPANITELCGTHKDILIPSSCLNAVITGLISRTFLRSDIIGKNDFHGAVFYQELLEKDLSNAYLNCIEKKFDYSKQRNLTEEKEYNGRGLDVVRNIARQYRVEDINFVKPGIGETTRVLLRRVPWKILVDKSSAESVDLSHIRLLALEKGVTVEVSEVNLGNYKCCGLIKKMADI
jgi:hypothetical protein